MKIKESVIKALSLGTGIAIGVVLIAKVLFELSFDSYYKDNERVYMIMTGYERSGESPKTANRISGAVAPGFKECVPGVEAATRVTGVFENERYYTADKNVINARLMLADTSFLDIFGRKIYSGDPHRIFNEWGKVMVSRSFAEKIGGMAEAVGQAIYNESLPQAKFTIEGVYEDFPENSTFGKIDILLSVESYNKNSTENWLGNDRYLGYVKLQEGVLPKSLEDAIHAMQQKYQSLEELEKSGLKLWYYLERADSVHMSEPLNRNMVIMLALVAFLLISVSVVNYILDVISSVVCRAKEVGVRRCYGAMGRNILALLLKETSLHILLSAFLAICIILALSNRIEALLNASLASLFTSQAILVSVVVCAVVLLVAGAVSANIYMKIPVSTAFRNYKKQRRRWKQAFLIVQFTFTVFLFCIMAVFTKQYNIMLNHNLGYEYDNLLLLDMPGAKSSEFFKIKNEIGALPQVKGVAVVSEIPVAGSSGNNVYLPGSEKELFNIADQYYSSEGAAEVLGIKFIEGREPQSRSEVAVSRKFVERMQNFADWSDGAIGKGIILTEHSRSLEDIFTVCGVYEDYKIGSIEVDERPSIRFGANERDENLYLRYVLVKLADLTANDIAAIQKIADNLYPHRNIEVTAYSNSMMRQFADVARIKDSILLGGIFSLVISLLGLIGYIKDETRRRSAEMAVRKINGALPKEIIALFLSDIIKSVAIAVVLGDIAAFAVSGAVLQLFMDKTEIGVWLYLAADAAVVAVVFAAVIANSLRISRGNPVESLKNE